MMGDGERRTERPGISTGSRHCALLATRSYDGYLSVYLENCAQGVGWEGENQSEQGPA